MGDPRCLQADCAFRHGAHTVRLTLARSALAVEVEAHLTGHRWRGQFDAAFIEDLTHKTGNFKQFGIFCSMLESALTQSSESVSLELLTYADLETLRSRKMGASARPPLSAASPLSAKRYLILVYSVEFDRIHYPLPLPYAGGPDPAALLRALREELAQLRTRRGEDRRDAEIRCLRDELEEKRVAEAALQRAARRLEEELSREKARHRQLAAELAEVKVSEQRLQLRVKSLTAELASCKKGRRMPTSTVPRPQGRRSASRESHGGSQGHPPLRSPSPAGPRPPRFDPTAFVRARQCRQKETELKNQRRRAAFGSASPARSRGRSSSAESFRSWRSAVSSGSEADERCEPKPPRGRRVTCTRRPLSASSCNGSGAARRPAVGHKLPVGSAASKHPGKENCYEEPSAELAEIDARLQALQEYMDSLDTRT
ncbi:centrosomal protein CCDC61 [Tyto alba]|uniref:centrosomal protein CCDC61 n=1 Tax=Tyto alba TaxID=56313 RepID=UPI001C667522|nr:centrosomal protein CCDC61 [Tyto alba]XP_042653241.1 centrosomal protein CCDC61 [Tyto alba]